MTNEELKKYNIPRTNSDKDLDIFFDFNLEPNYKQ